MSPEPRIVIEDLPEVEHLSDEAPISSQRDTTEQFAFGTLVAENLLAALLRRRYKRREIAMSGEPRFCSTYPACSARQSADCGVRSLQTEHVG